MTEKINKQEVINKDNYLIHIIEIKTSFMVKNLKKLKNKPKIIKFNPQQNLFIKIKINSMDYNNGSSKIDKILKIIIKNNLINQIIKDLDNYIDRLQPKINKD